MEELKKTEDAIETKGEVTTTPPAENPSNSSNEVKNDLADANKKWKVYMQKISTFLFSDWKKDLKKFWKLLSLASVIIIILGTIVFFKGNLFGWKLDIFAKKVTYKTYSHLAPDFKFNYADYFEIDTGEGKTYGSSYLTGFKLKTDTRTGCDIRAIKSGLNFDKSDEEIKNALSKELSSSAKDFQLIRAKRIKLGGEKAFSMEFSFIDPINSRVHINQIMTGKDKNYYAIICGTGDYQYKYFEKDFKDFISSFKWSSK